MTIAVVVKEREEANKVGPGCQWKPEMVGWSTKYQRRQSDALERVSIIAIFRLLDFFFLMILPVPSCLRACSGMMETVPENLNCFGHTYYFTFFY